MCSKTKCTVPDRLTEKPNASRTHDKRHPTQTRPQTCLQVHSWPPRIRLVWLLRRVHHYLASCHHDQADLRGLSRCVPVKRFSSIKCSVLQQAWEEK